MTKGSAGKTLKMTVNDEFLGATYTAALKATTGLG
jgi:hypothetical protein